MHQPQTYMCPLRPGLPPTFLPTPSLQLITEHWLCPASTPHWLSILPMAMLCLNAILSNHPTSSYAQGSKGDADIENRHLDSIEENIFNLTVQNLEKYSSTSYVTTVFTLTSGHPGLLDTVLLY